MYKHRQGIGSQDLGTGLIRPSDENIVIIFIGVIWSMKQDIKDTKYNSQLLVYNNVEWST